MLKAIVADLNEVDEVARPFYAEKDGKFYLNVTPTDGWTLENVDGLKNALGAERKKAGDLETKIKEYGDIDPKKAADALKKVEKFSNFDPEKEADKIAEEKFKNKEAQLVSRHQDAIQLANSALEARTTQLKKLLVDNAIKAELGKLNPLEDARDAIELLAAQSVRTKEVNGEFVVEVVDNGGNPRIKDVHGNPMGIADFLTELRDKRPSLFKADDKRGIGMQPNTGAGGGKPNPSNPWLKDSINYTEQMKLLNTNPTLAARYKQEAGVR
ncbi:MAG: hypothetical protein KDK08_05730 [Rhizobiaceae bacterium]|nr:hypothetical protein [Rhizobiaceae bacterium]MCC0000960.1 hypothetical protein [Methylobacteriaceae bacterium]